MSKLRIFIEGRELDTLDNVTVPITKQYEELSNPTIICNDYSKTVTVPLSKNNNDIFGHCYIPDRLISTSGDEDTPIVGIYFDPYKKLDCRLQWGDDVFFTGYAKMIKVTNAGYELTFNAELGKVFQDLQKITFDRTKYETADDIAKYYIDGSKYVNTTINKELVYNCWNSTLTDFNLYTTDNANYDITQLIGFIPNNSFSNDFEYDTYEDSESTATTFIDTLDSAIFGPLHNKTFSDLTGYTSDAVVGDGLYPAQVQDWRCYNQIPFIYWNKFWKIFQNKAEELTGYSWEYSEWATDQNKNFNGLAISLLPRDSMNFADDNLCDPNFTLTMNTASYSCISGTTAQINTTQHKGSDFPTYNAKIAITPSFTIKFAAPAGSDSPAGVAGFFYDQFTDNNFYYGGLIVHYYWTDTNGTTEFLNVGFCKAATSGQTGYNDPLAAFKKRYDLDAYYAISNTAVPAGGSSTTTVDFSFQADSNLYGYVTTRGSAGQITAKFEFVRFSYYDGATYTIPAGSVLKVTRSASTTTPDSFTLYSKQTDAQVTYYKTFYRSGDQFTLNDICNLTFDNILDYCKRFRIFIFVDEANKKLIFQRASKYFSTNIAYYAPTIDRSTQFDIEPITFDKHYLTFGYSEPNSMLGESYKNMYASYPYGAKQIITNYEFNNDTETLFSKSTESILYSPTYLYWGNLTRETPDLTFWIYNNNFLESRDSSGNTINIAGAYFYPTKHQIDSYYTNAISDDTPAMQLVNKYYYNLNYTGDDLLFTKYWTQPELVQREEQMYPYQYYTCLFDLPKTNYVAQNDYYSRCSNTVYSTFWQTYLNERYNVQNKKVTTYVLIRPTDYINFKFNQFWQIGNQLYIVNKIFDYDITSTKPTKVELLTVQNINAYKS